MSPRLIRMKLRLRTKIRIAGRKKQMKLYLSAPDCLPSSKRRISAWLLRLGEGAFSFEPPKTSSGLTSRGYCSSLSMPSASGGLRTSSFPPSDGSNGRPGLSLSLSGGVSPVSRISSLFIALHLLKRQMRSRRQDILLSPHKEPPQSEALL